MERVVNIETLGRHGDGITHADGETLYVSRVLAGEKVRIEASAGRGSLVELIEPSPMRRTPFCRHYDHCGGCAVQHLDPDLYVTWKRDIVATALAHRNLSAPLDPLVDAQGSGRRRVTLHAATAGSRLIVGFAELRSHRLFDLDICPILAPELSRAAEIAYALATAAKPKRRCDIQLVASETGIDALLIGLPAPSLPMRLALGEVAAQFDLARVCLGEELILERRAPVLTMGKARVRLPAGSFLQATGAGEEMLAAAVTDHLGDCRRVADLFCGVGPFALRLAAQATVHAADQDGAAVAALLAAARATRGLNPMTAVERNLFTRPFAPDELVRFDGVVFDPPRAGAEAQARALAASKVKKIVAVACDPASFARDAATLVAGGYRLERVTPVDQFKWSAHVEIVGRFSRGS